MTEHCAMFGKVLLTILEELLRLQMKLWYTSIYSSHFSTHMFISVSFLFFSLFCFNLHLSNRFTRLHFLWQWITRKRKLSLVSEEPFHQRWFLCFLFVYIFFMLVFLQYFWNISWPCSPQCLITPTPPGQVKFSWLNALFSNSYTLHP